MAQQYRRQDGTLAEVGALKSIAHTYPAVTNAAGGSTILAYSVDYTYILVVNNSADTVTITIEGTTPTTALGIPLRPSGGYYEMSAAFGNLPTGAIKGIAAAGAVNVFVTAGKGL